MAIGPAGRSAPGVRPDRAAVPRKRSGSPTGRLQAASPHPARRSAAGVRLDRAAGPRKRSKLIRPGA
jgi:hypothetical protein